MGDGALASCPDLVLPVWITRQTPLFSLVFFSFA